MLLNSPVSANFTDDQNGRRDIERDWKLSQCFKLREVLHEIPRYQLTVRIQYGGFFGPSRTSNLFLVTSTGLVKLEG